MGGQNSKLEISKNATMPATGETQGTVKEVTENGNADIVKTADETVESAPQTEETTVAAKGDESKCSVTKKKNPISWIQKKISFKKLSTPKKQCAPAEKSDQTEHTEEKEAPVHSVEAQSEEVAKVDQSVGHSDNVGPEPIVEIVPIENGISDEHAEHYEEPVAPISEDAHNVEAKKTEISVNDSGLSEKLSDFDINQANPVKVGLQNGHEEHIEN